MDRCKGEEAKNTSKQRNDYADKLRWLDDKRFLFWQTCVWV